MRVRRSRLPPDPRQAAEPGRTRCLQGEAGAPARPARGGAHGARAVTGVFAPDGRDAHGRLGARLHAAGKRRPQRGRRARYRRPADRLARVHAVLLVSLEPQRAHDRRRDRRRFRGRTLPASVARQGANGEGGACHAYLADPVRRARVQCLDLHLARDSRHRCRYVLGHYRRHRRPARTQARRRQRGCLRHPEPLRPRRRGRDGHPHACRNQGNRDRFRAPGLHGE